MFYGRKLRRAAKFAWVLAVNAAILAILLEVSGLAYFALRDGHLYYLGRDEIVTARVAEMGTGLNGADPEELRRRLKEGLSQNKFRLNPYYGYQYEANYRVPVEDFHIRPAEMASNCKFRVNVLCDHGSVYFVTNNFGFDSVLNYPYRKQSDDEFVIGIFGGSIALSVVKLTMPQLFDEVFAQVPQLHGKKVVLLSFAREGFKQPQELETLAYFLSLGQRFDLVINIDGASEIFDAIINYNARVNHSMPSNGQLSALTGLIDAAIHETGNEAFLGVYFWRSVRERILRSLLDVPLAGPAFCWISASVSRVAARPPQRGRRSTRPVSPGMITFSTCCPSRREPPCRRPSSKELRSGNDPPSSWPKCCTASASPICRSCIRISIFPRSISAMRRSGLRSDGATRWHRKCMSTIHA